MSEPRPPVRGQIPGWLAVLLILLCVGAGGWLVYWYSREAPPKVIEVTLPSNPAGPARQRGAFAQPRGDGVFATGRNTWRIQAGQAIMDVQKPAKGDATIACYFTRNALPAQDQEWLWMRRSVIDTKSPAAVVMELTPDQVDKLKKVALVDPMVLDATDKTRTQQLWAAYDAATGEAKVAAERELATGWRAISAKALAPTQKAVADAAKQVRAIVSDAQMQKFLQSRRGTPPPASRPTTAVAATRPARTRAPATRTTTAPVVNRTTAPATQPR